MQYYVEYLTLRAWILVILPRILRHRSDHHQLPGCRFFDASWLGLLAARLSARCISGLSVTRLDFRISDVHDENGLPIRLRIHYADLKEAHDEVRAEPAFRAFAKWAHGQDRLSDSIMKKLAFASFDDRQTLWRALFVIQVSAWWQRQNSPGSDSLLFLESRPWFGAIQRYAAHSGLKAQSVPQTTDLKDFPGYILGVRGMWLLRALRNSFSRRPLKRDGEEKRIRLMTDYWGYFNLNRPECYSDFFFIQASAVPAASLLMTFSMPGDPIDEDRAREFKRLGMRALALNPRATTTSSVSIYKFWPSLSNLAMPPRFGSRQDDRWLEEQVRDYRLRREYWLELFRSENVRLCTSWFRYDNTHCALADALKELNGVMTIYQRACQPDASPEVAVHTDVAFGYAPMDARVEQRSGSTIRYHVSVGYFGDHRFKLLRQPASEVRAQLRHRGAQYIVAFFDENSREDERWHTGHRFQRANYEFLLEKVLADPALGLVLKPKVPSTLRKRLGPVSDLLRRALETGRCFLYEEGAIQGIQPPAVAAMVADVAIHSHLSAATAGLEAALAGTPSLLLDRENWYINDLYALGVGRVIFRSWPELWSALGEHRLGKAPPGFGDWSPMLDRLDPFRDGRGAERLGTYLLWLLKGLEQGGAREAVMADAAERYCRQWGHDKVTEVREEMIR